MYLCEEISESFEKINYSTIYTYWSHRAFVSMRVYWLRYAIINFILLRFILLVSSHVCFRFTRCVVQHHGLLDRFFSGFAPLHTIPLRYISLTCAFPFLWVSPMFKHLRTLKSYGVVWFVGISSPSVILAYKSFNLCWERFFEILLWIKYTGSWHSSSGSLWCTATLLLPLYPLFQNRGRYNLNLISTIS